MQKFNSKLPNLGTTIFTVMSQLAKEENAINLSQGFPDFEAHPKLIELLSKYMKQGANQYAPMAGILPLREMIAQKTEELYGISCDAEEEVTVVSGASEAIFNAMASLIRPQDEVIIFEPAYDLYTPVAELFGGKVVPIALSKSNYSIDWKKLEQSISEHTKLIIINSPHNPTGAVLRKEDLAKLEQIIADRKIFVISDEVYEHIIFDGIAHESALKYPALRAKSFVVSSFGKTFHTTGWKIGYCIAPRYLSKEFRKIHQYNTFSTFTPAQFALAEFLQEKHYYLELPQFYEERRDKFRSLMQNTAFRLLPCEGTYFQLVGYEHLSQEKDTDYSKRLTKEVGVATIPISVFYNKGTDNKVLRFCFAKTYQTMEAAVEKLIKQEDLLKSP